MVLEQPEVLDSVLELELEVQDLELQELDLVWEVQEEQEVPELELVVLDMELEVQEEQEGLVSVLDMVQEASD